MRREIIRLIQVRSSTTSLSVVILHLLHLDDRRCRIEAVRTAEAEGTTGAEAEVEVEVKDRTVSIRHRRRRTSAQS